MKENLGEKNSEIVNIDENKTKLDSLIKDLSSIIAEGPAVPEDYTFTVNGDTLLVSCDKAFRENILNGLSKAQKLLGFNENIKNIKQVGNKIHADLIVPVGEISKIELEIEKYRV